MKVVENAPLAPWCTLGLGGRADRLVEVATEADLVAAVVDADAHETPLVVLGGGSNVVIADAGVRGTVVRVATNGIEVVRGDAGVTLTVAAGTPWSDVVELAVSEGWAGIEALAGIPGRTGATPIQNVGAYGQEVGQTLVAVRVYDRVAASVVELTAADCGLAYRHSIFRDNPRYVVLAVTFRLSDDGGYGRPIAYPELAKTLGVEAGARAPIHDTRDAVVALRRRKGMVLDPSDPDTRSAGSFFTNPRLDASAFAVLTRRVAARGIAQPLPSFAQPDGTVKTSAAWLLEHAGYPAGTRRGAVAQSTKHALAVVTTPDATTADLVAFAREMVDAVIARFGVELRPEPIFLGHTFA